MKFLKSSIKNLRELFDRNVSLSFVTEPIISFDADAQISQVKSFVDNHSFDFIGVRKYGEIVGYGVSEQFRDGVLSDYLIEFVEDEIVDENAPIIDAISKMLHKSRLFVRSFGHVNGIVTRGDLQKAPVRMWLFSLVSLFEMQMLRIVREAHPGDSWKEYLKEARIEASHRILQMRKSSNEEIDLADCLQFCDKRDIILESSKIFDALELDSKNSCKKFFKELEILRNNLAHSQDIKIGDDWGKTIELAIKAEAILTKLEKISFLI